MKTKLISLIALLIFSFSGYSQSNENWQLRSKVKFPENVTADLTKKEKAMISEVYKSKMKSLVLKDEAYLKDLKHLLRNRIEIFEINDPSKQKKCKLLSDIPLNDSYNTKLRRDINYNKSKFNPLKYQLDFFAKGTYLYRIDNTNYFIKVISQFRQ